jgi:hypothetical protein
VGCRTSRDDDGPSRRLARPAAATVRLAKRARGRRVRAPANRSSRRRPATAGPGAVGCLRLRFLPGALFGLFKLSASRPREQDHARPHRCHRLIGAQARLLATCASMPGVASTVSLPVVAGGMAVSEPIRAELKTAMAATGATSHPRIARGAENRPVPKAACAYLAQQSHSRPLVSQACRKRLYDRQSGCSAGGTSSRRSLLDLATPAKSHRCLRARRRLRSSPRSRSTRRSAPRRSAGALDLLSSVIPPSLVLPSTRIGRAAPAAMERSGGLSQPAPQWSGVADAGSACNARPSAPRRVILPRRPLWG